MKVPPDHNKGLQATSNGHTPLLIPVAAMESVNKTINFNCTIMVALRTKNRRKGGEPGRIYHVRNVIGRENLITCGRTNELSHAVRTEYSCDSFMADRMGLDGTMLHYLTVWKAMVSVHKPVHSKITLTYSLTWQADRYTSRRMAFKVLLNTKARPFPSLCSSFLCTYCSKKNPPEWASHKKKTATCTVDCQSTTCVGTSTIHLHSIKSSLPFSLLYVTHVINYFRPSPAFPYWK